MEAFVAVAIVLLILAIGAVCWIVITVIQKGQKRHKHRSSSSTIDYGDVHAGYANLYNIGAQTGITGYIHFDSEGVLSDFFTVGGSGSELTFGTLGGGVYEISYTVTPSTGLTGTSLFGVEKNSILIPGSMFGAVIPGQADGSVLVDISPGETIRVRNLSTMVSLAELPDDQVNASLIAVRIG
jgi:hypothetical protein